MGYHPRVESRDLASFLTTRTINSQLWFVNNRPLQEAVLGYAAKYQKRYGVKLYGLAIQGNHIHGAALFPKTNRSDFMRDFNSTTARAVPRYVQEFPGGIVWARRYSAEWLPGENDIEEYFFYIVLQPVKDGLVERLSDYPGYNCFHDAAWNIKRRYKVVNWAEYNSAKRFNPRASISDFTEEVELQYERLPGYEHMSQKEYAKMLHEKLEERRKALVKKRLESGRGFVGREALRRTPRGAFPRNTKKSLITDHRPRVLSVCPRRRRKYLSLYFQIYFAFREASADYRNGNLEAEFPEGTFRPFLRPPPPKETASF